METVGDDDNINDGGSIFIEEMKSYRVVAVAHSSVKHRVLLLAALALCRRAHPAAIIIENENRLVRVSYMALINIEAYLAKMKSKEIMAAASKMWHRHRHQ